MPVLAEQMLNTAVGTFDTFLAGRISAAATSAIGLAAYVGWLVSMIIMLVGTGTTALVARHTGAGDHGQANRFANQSLALGGLLGLTVMAAMYLAAPWFATYCNMSGETYDVTVRYLRTSAFAYAFMGVTLVGCAALRGVGNMRMPMFIFAIINTINIIASCTLVYGLGPFPSFGVQGIVAGTVIAQTLGGFLTVIVLWRGRAGLKLHRSELAIAWNLARRILRIGLPAAADGAFMWSGHFVFLAIISRLAEGPLGEAYFAAHIVAIRVEALTYLPAVAWATATATMIGQALGTNDATRARRTGDEGVLQCGLLSVMVALLFYLGADAIYELMSTDALVRQAGTEPFRILALLQPLLVIAIVYIGGLRGAGDTRFPLLITLVGIVIRISVGFVCGLLLQLGLLGAWTGMFSDMGWRAFAARRRFAGGRWIHTKV